MPKFIEVHCDFCLESLAHINPKRLDNNVNSTLMLAHKPNCPSWNPIAAKLMKIKDGP